MSLAISSNSTASLQPSSFSPSQQQALSTLIMSMLTFCIQRMVSDMMQAANQSSNGFQPPNETSLSPSPSTPTSNQPYSTNPGGQYGNGNGNGHNGNGGGGNGSSYSGTGNGSTTTNQTYPTTNSQTSGNHVTPSSTGTQAPLPPGKVVTAPAGIQNKPIVVHKGEVFDGKGQTYIGGPGLGDGSQNEHQQPLFVVEDGGSLCNVQMDGGGDGVHFMGSGRMVNCVNKNVSEDAITVNGAGNNAHDSKIAGCGETINGRPKVEIINCTFNNASDKVVQDNGSADVVMSGVTVNGAGKVFRTNGGHDDIDSTLEIENCQFNQIKESVFRTDAPNSTVKMSNLTTDAPDEVIAPNASQAVGATRIGYKPYTG
ncbi:Pectate lyase C precursor [Xanthomonas fragariae]|uniref:Pectate lyase n=2 Tax=Xanthomonas fragariae TaxID=48664 RepID=A0ABY1RMQ3_9XANT|nr:Pectate lyase C precursor [Xanthomonas fragariae]